MLIFVGLSHLSLCYAAAASLKGFNVGIVDFKNNIENFYSRKFNVFEPKLESIIKSKKILISSDFKIINKANVIFLSKDLQTSRANKVNYSEINNLFSGWSVNIFLKSVDELPGKKIVPYILIILFFIELILIFVVEDISLELILLFNFPTKLFLLKNLFLFLNFSLISKF